MKEKGIRFVVAGRKMGNGEFMELSDIEIEGKVGEDFRDMFEGLSEAQFRNDISSTELREKG